MCSMDRRQFIKSVAVGTVGTMALAGPNLGEAAPEAAGQAAQAKASGKKQAFEVFALKYAGPFERKLAMALFNTGWNEDIAINFYTWAIRAHDGSVTLVDAGTGPTQAKQRNLKNFTPPEELVARLGVNSDKVDKVIITHMHYDHVGGVEVYPRIFPKAKFYVQKKELDFWLRSPISKRAPYKGLRGDEGAAALAALGGRLVVVDGDKALGPDMTLLLTPGHTPGLQSVLVNTAKGKAIVASDSAHLARSFKEDVPSSLITDLPAWLTSFDKLRAAAPVENIFPGHDSLMLSQYPKVAEDVTRLA
jgi:glyoxylase-like metal-dependent hydrolase (beta-lactamase superfamily II)